MRVATGLGVCLVVVVSAVGCHRSAAGFASCAENLGGVYEVVERPGERWAVLDPPNGRLEMYPLFDDTHDPVAPRDWEVGPRVLDVMRTEALMDPGLRRGDGPGATDPDERNGTDPDGPGATDPDGRNGTDPDGPGANAPGPTSGAPSGTVTRRYMRGADRCDATAAVTLTRCARDVIELVLADPVPPTRYAPCAYGESRPARRERWRRLR